MRSAPDVRIHGVRTLLPPSRRLRHRLNESASASRSDSRPPASRSSKVGIPVSWQIAPSPYAAWLMFSAMIVSACPARVPPF